MKNLRLIGLLVIVFLFSSFLKVKCQERVYFYEPASPVNRYSINAMELEGWQSINIAIVEQGNVNYWKPQKIGNLEFSVMTGKNTQNFNRLSLYSLGLDGKLLGKVQQLYTVNGDNIITGDSSSDLLDSYSMEEIQEEFPRVFNPTERYQYSYLPNMAGFKRITYKFDPYNASFFPEESQILKMSQKNPEMQCRRDNPYLIDSVNHVVTAIFGIVDQSVKNNEFMSYEFTSYDRFDEISGTFTLNFQYPRMLLSQSTVFSTQTNEPVGKMFIFENRIFIRKKYADPEKNNFEVVYCDNNGNLIFHKTIKLTEHPKGSIYIHGAYGDGEFVNVHYNIFAEEQQIAIAKFDYEGNVTMYNYPKSEFESVKEIISGESSSIFNLSRAQLSQLSQKPGLNWGLGGKFILLGAKQLESELIVYGQMVYSIDDPDYVVPIGPDGRPITSFPPATKIKLYGEMVFFRYKNDHELQKAYIQEFQLEKEPHFIKLIDNHVNSASFYVPISGALVLDTFHSVRTMNDESNIGHTGYAFKNFYFPLIINIGKKAENKIVKYTSLFDKQNGVFARKDLIASFIIVGFALDSEGKHYFKVDSINF